jgi:histidinol phosphatase-like PHP family hydrolase
MLAQRLRRVVGAGMRPPAFKSEGRWFRGNLHTHSDRSDGVVPPGQVLAEYRAAGYDFLVLTDHFEARWGWTVTDTTAARSEAFTTLLGAELSSADWDDEDVFWVNAIGLPADFAAPRQDEPPAAAIRRAADAGAYNVLLHPGLTNLLEFDRLPVEHLHAVETYNQNAAVAWPDQAEARYAADALLARGHRLHVTVGDDAHWHHRWDRFAAWVEVRADRLDPDALLSALKTGAYYSTQGPRIDDVQVDDGRVLVSCGPARSVALTGIHGWRSDVVTGERLERAALDLGKLRSPYWRLTITDVHGKRAWTNPVWQAEDPPRR